MVLTGLWWFALVATAVGLVQKTAGLSLAGQILQSRTDGTSVEEAPSVSLICPVRGEEEGLEERLRQLCQQGYAGPLEVLICAETPGDPAVPVARSVAEDYEHAQLVVSEEIGVPGIGKGKNMIAGARKGRGEVLLFVDSDVAVEKKMTARVAPSALEAGLVFRLPVCVGAENLFAALHAFTVNEAVLAVAPQWQDGEGKTVFGSTMALHREVFEDIEGETAIARAAADDTALSKAIRKEGRSLHLLPRPARSVHRRDNLIRWAYHQLRWMVILRRYSPAGIAALLPLLHSSFWGLLAVVIALAQGGGAAFSGLVATAAIGIEIGSQRWVVRRFAEAPGLRKYLPAVPLADLLRIPLWPISWTTNRVWWRGRWLRVEKDGELNPEN